MIADSAAWHRLSLGDGITSATMLDAIKEAFELIDRGRRGPAAIFKRFDSTHGLHCEVTVYFSPGVADLAEEFSASMCRKPARAGLELLAGDAEILSGPIETTP